MKQPLAPKGGNDRVYTPPEIAKLIIDHFQPSGRILEPCRGKGSFSSQMKCDWTEIDEGLDFFNVTEKYDYIVTGPPWSLFRPFLKHSMTIADNIIFLCLTNAWFMRARQRDIKEAGFGMVELLDIPVPPKPWPQAGFCLSAGYIKRGYTGDLKLNRKFI